jgi:ATP-grasp domain, R2K clade family 3
VPDSIFENPGTLSRIPTDAEVVYRGWMVDARQYQNFVASVRESGGTALISVEIYLLAHHLPNWYPLLRDLTAETLVFPEDVNLEAELRRLNWPGFFIKDYVKSLKTAAGSLITDPAEAQRVVDDMRRYRGTIEGGLCVRRAERFRPDSETRYFVLRGRPFAPAPLTVPGIVHQAAGRIDHPFFSIDIALTESGDPRIVEIGDGQVSDLVGWTTEDFIHIWRNNA